ncbi:DUF2799 domain-containing protein [Maritalea porphyrae]|uniref:DUF2799 domain-containing protein n=1 Tax=Maritalea porphyrae TaxID=880732 RepID=UPI0022AEE9BB|nr:DUF2799 domain-containing protein [Maritalea porphyrae]MCZ4271863.1 DUF2799 domain-containing protein [Maritalea porphyrae]
MRYLVLTASFLLLAVLAGCATLSKSQCQTGDWQSVGEADGRAGHSTARFSEHNEACSKHGISVDRSLYNKGHAAGLKFYCTPNNAAKVGLAGRSYNGVCTGEMGISFLRIYREANDVHSIDKDIESLQNQIETLTEKLAQPDITQADRDDIVSDIRFLNYDVSRKMRDRAREDAELRQVLLEEQNRLSRL